MKTYRVEVVIQTEQDAFTVVRYVEANNVPEARQKANDEVRENLRVFAKSTEQR